MADQAQTEDQKKLVALENQLATVTNERDTLKEQLQKATSDSAGVGQQLLTALDKGEKLTAENASLKAAKEASDQTAQQALSVVGELKEQLAEQAAGSKKIPTIKVGTKTYELLGDFSYKGQEVTLELLKENATLAAELVKEGVADLRLVAQKA